MTVSLLGFLFPPSEGTALPCPIECGRVSCGAVFVCLSRACLVLVCCRVCVFLLVCACVCVCVCLSACVRACLVQKRCMHVIEFVSVRACLGDGVGNYELLNCSSLCFAVVQKTYIEDGEPFQEQQLHQHQQNNISIKRVTTREWNSHMETKRIGDKANMLKHQIVNSDILC